VANCNLPLFQFRKFTHSKKAYETRRPVMCYWERDSWVPCPIPDHVLEKIFPIPDLGEVVEIRFKRILISESEIDQLQQGVCDV
jgi:hypothetical protein